MCIYSVMRNYYESSISYEVVVTVNKFTIHDWYTLRASLLYIINKVAKPDTSGGHNIGVLFIPGSTRFGHSSVEPDDQQRPGKSFMNSCKEIPDIGASLGAIGEESGGTLGGYMALTFDSQTYRGFLTSSHMMQPAASTDPTLLQRYENNGVSLSDHKTVGIQP